MKKTNISTKKEAYLPISVVMPVYNAELYIDDAIESILKQTFSEFEFIIIDDGSTDNTWSIIQSYKDKRIIALQNKTNLGNYPSRNKGMKIAKGKYIAVMDGDDIAMPERLEKQFFYLEKKPDIIALGTEYLSDSKSKEKIPLKYQDICLDLLSVFRTLHPSLMIRANMINSIGGYNEKYKYASDCDLYASLIFLGKVENLPDVLMTYRSHENQISKAKIIEQNRYANIVQKKYQKSFIDKYKSEEQDAILMPELGMPEIGLSICYYTYSKHCNDGKFKEMADKTIDVIHKVITVDTPISIERGLCGLGCGLHYLIRNKFLDGDVDEVLEDIDNQIIATLQRKDDNCRKYMQDIQFYLKYRILKSDNKDNIRMKHIIAIYTYFFDIY